MDNGFQICNQVFYQKLVFQMSRTIENFKKGIFSRNTIFRANLILLKNCTLSKYKQKMQSKYICRKFSVIITSDLKALDSN